MQRRVLTSSLSLLESFPPAQWNEDSCVRAPPFVSEDSDGTVVLIPSSPESSQLLDGVSLPLGLRKAANGQPYFMTSKADAVRALRSFHWFVRRSWRNHELAILWATAYAVGRQSKDKPTVSPQSIAEMTGCAPDTCIESLRSLLRTRDPSTQVTNFGQYEVDPDLLRAHLERHLEGAPTQTEELVMDALCSRMSASVPDIYSETFPHDLTVGAVYKVAAGLKKEGYVHTIKHFRVNDRGPMRELLCSNCRNCFYGYSSAETCFEDAFREMERILRRTYHKELSEEERARSYSAMKSAPFGPKVIRKVLEALKLIHHMDALMNEKNVVSVLRKLEDWYGVEFPLRQGPAVNLSNIGSGQQ